MKLAYIVYQSMRRLPRQASGRARTVLSGDYQAAGGKYGGSWGATQIFASNTD
jgi:hypothetical protein